MSKTIRKFIMSNLNKFYSSLIDDLDKESYSSLSTSRKKDADKAISIMLDFLESDLDLKTNYNYSECINKNQALFEFVDMARRHHIRGVNLSMYMSAFKKMYNSLIKLIIESNEQDSFKFEILKTVIDKFNFGETVIISEWDDNIKNDISCKLLENAAELSVAKCKIQNILDSVHNIVLTFNADGYITQHNLKGKAFFGEKITSLKITELLNLENCSVNQFIDNYNDTEIDLGNNKYFELKIKFLGDDYFGQREYLFSMTNITSTVEYRNNLECEVYEKTQDLFDEKLFFESVFFTTGEALIVFENGEKLNKINHSACELFKINKGCDNESLQNIIHEFLCLNKHLVQTFNRLKNGDKWAGECKLMLPHREIHAYISLNKFLLRDVNYCCLSVKDISELKKVEQALVWEKRVVEEKNIALKNIIETIKQQNEDFRVTFLSDFEKEFIPLLKRMYTTDFENEKYECYHKICKKLRVLSDISSDNEYSDAYIEILSKLSQAEERVLKMVVKGQTTKEIAAFLCISEYTVQTHRRNIRKKLDLNKKQMGITAYIRHIQNMEKVFYVKNKYFENL